MFKTGLSGARILDICHAKGEGMAAEDKCYRVSWDAQAGVARTDWLPGARCGIAEAQAVDVEIKALGRGKVLCMVDLRDGVQIDRPAREFFIDQNPNYRAVALLAQNAPARMLANFFLGLKRGSIPLRMFAVEADAIDWLQSQP
jgi:hypothetical protein